MLDRATRDRRPRKSNNLLNLERRSARVRKARHLERRRDGEFIAPVEVDASVVDLLVRLTWLEDRLAADRHVIGRAENRRWPSQSPDPITKKQLG